MDQEQNPEDIEPLVYTPSPTIHNWLLFEFIDKYQTYVFSRGTFVGRILMIKKGEYINGYQFQPGFLYFGTHEFRSRPDIVNKHIFHNCDTIFPLLTQCKQNLDDNWNKL